ncbi:MAG: hypothetical protein E5X49_32765 [Mesorhizobium sp.]|nr:hypothetical protein [Mesorhizobium sp.]TIQ36371.1 MAG: hypothetical protein E5X49_32765 [Mesorhizobium sp.]TIW59482.1 MAG: hypothetical protein E5V48_17665 [Mesorhizobium sp.]TJW31291.1 MAG: hypothetical protein E5V49_17090 [Mesorhizobium sp.]
MIRQLRFPIRGSVIGRPAKDWLAPDIAKVIAMMTAVADGMATLDETFPPLKVEDAEVEEINTGLDQFAAGEPEENPDRFAETSDPGAAAGVSSEHPPSCPNLCGGNPSSLLRSI